MSVGCLLSTLRKLTLLCFDSAIAARNATGLPRRADHICAQVICIGVLQCGLQRLTLGANDFKQPFPDGSLPMSLERIRVALGPYYGDTVADTDTDSTVA